MRIGMALSALLLVAAPVVAKKLTPTSYADSANTICDWLGYDSTATPNILSFTGAGASGPFCIEASVPADAFYLAASGFIGLGTTSPAVPLHVLKTGNSEVARFEVSEAGTPAAWLAIYDTGGRVAHWGMGSSGDDNVHFMNDTAGGSLLLGTVGGAALTIDSSKDSTFVGGVEVGGFLSLGPSIELTIAAGVVTATRSYHIIDTQSDDAADDLDTINGCVAGKTLVLSSASSGRDTTAKDGTGNLRLAGDFVLSHYGDTLSLICNGTDWLQTSRSDNDV